MWQCNVWNIFLNLNDLSMQRDAEYEIFQLRLLKNTAAAIIKPRSAKGTQRLGKSASVINGTATEEYKDISYGH